MPNFRNPALALLGSLWVDQPYRAINIVVEEDYDSPCNPFGPNGACMQALLDDVVHRGETRKCHK
jgi:hypothetical protein